MARNGCRATNIKMNALHIGTCSWKYPSWRGLVYSDTASPNYLAEYAQQYDCVEVDQWFWSLHGPDRVVLPKPQVVAEYAASVPDSFRFGIKMPNALTMTHFRPEKKADPLVPNPHFLSRDLLLAFLDRLEPMRGKLGPLMFQFGYLNKRMVSSEQEFLDQLGTFACQLPADYTWCVESRNPNFLSPDYFQILCEHRMAHVFLQGYYLPSIFGIYEKYADQLADAVIIRLLGPDRQGIEERTGKDWSKIIEPRDADLDALANMLNASGIRSQKQWLFVNNHFEGCAPLTIKRIQDRMPRETA
ncbi:MAG: DUF72 domain-containing protein [Lentisphaerae bacterium]|nr:DUF72 domain-containing protein [Lentisphaerota bacterium]